MFDKYVKGNTGIMNVISNMYNASDNNQIFCVLGSQYSPATYRN
jgi:hypothetical protein